MPKQPDISVGADPGARPRDGRNNNGGTGERPTGGGPIGLVGRNPRVILAVVTLVTAAAVALASRLELRTAFAELLPSNDPGVVALNRTQKRLGDMSLLLVGIHSPDPAANERYAESLTRRLRAQPNHVADLAAYNIRDVRDFFDRNKWLYVKEPDLEDVRDRLRKEISKRKNPLFVDLSGDDEPIDQMQKRIAGQERLDSRFPDGLFATPDKKYLWVAALPPGGLFVEHAGEGLWAAVNRLIAEDPPSRYHPEMRVQPSGPVATAIASRNAVERDILSVTITCLLVVALSIGLYFRRLRSIPLIGIPAISGAVMAFAVAELSFGYLNSSTAFLGSIIVGNGINYAIVLMSRYDEERARGLDANRAISAAIVGTWRATSVAALCASAAYASLTVTSFRGFSQFGVMGSVGAVFCWLATYTVLPAMLVLLDRSRAGAKVNRGRPPLRLDWLGRLLARHFRPLMAAFTLMTILGAVGATHFLEDPFEYDFRKLNAKLDATEESKQFNKRMDQLFGRWPSPTVILADDLSEVEAVRDTIRRQDEERAKISRRGRKVIGTMATIWDLLPGPPEVQQRKLDLIGQIRKLTHDPALELLNEKERADLAKIDPPETLRTLAPLDLPPIARRPFTEVDGSVGKVVLVYPAEQGLSVWNGRDLLEIAAVLQYLKLPSGKVLETSGSAVVFGAMIRSVLHDGPIATLASLLAVLVIIMLIIRPVRIGLMAVTTLLAGVVWMVGAAGWSGVRVTFLNFIALPITFGIGAEYALNVVTRYREDKEILKAVTSTGAAVALCSWTTIVGYGSLLAARNQALQGFGSMAILGEAACLMGAITALPSAVLWWQARRARAAALGG
ncbi:MAG: MMPL family transporter [Myxococcales bacterium]